MGKRDPRRRELHAEFQEIDAARTAAVVCWYCLARAARADCLLGDSFHAFAYGTDFALDQHCEGLPNQQVGLHYEFARPAICAACSQMPATIDGDDARALERHAVRRDTVFADVVVGILPPEALLEPRVCWFTAAPPGWHCQAMPSRTLREAFDAGFRLRGRAFLDAAACGRALASASNPGEWSPDLDAHLRQCLALADERDYRNFQGLRVAFGVWSPV